MAHDSPALDHQFLVQNFLLIVIDVRTYALRYAPPRGFDSAIMLHPTANGGSVSLWKILGLTVFTKEIFISEVIVAPISTECEMSRKHAASKLFVEILM